MRFRNQAIKYGYRNEAGSGDGQGQSSGGNGDVHEQINAAVEMAVQGLKAKNSELLGKLKDQSEQLKRFEGIDPDAVRGILSKFADEEEATLIAGGDIDKVLENRTERMKADFDKQLGKATEAARLADSRASQYAARVLENGIRAEATAAGLHPFAIDDALFRARTTFQLDDAGNPVAAEGMYGKDGKPLTLKEWFADMKDKAPHWWPAIQGGGASGSGARCTARNGR